MNDKAAFAIKLLFALAVIVGLCAMVANSQAEPLTVLSVQASGGLNVREYPFIEARATHTLEDTDTVIVLKWCDGWALVADNSNKNMVLGWACGDYLK